jgi:hypothetical protein
MKVKFVNASVNPLEEQLEEIVFLYNEAFRFACGYLKHEYFGSISVRY